MTEAEWAACADPTPMLEFLRGRRAKENAASSLARARQLLHSLTDPRSRWAVEVAEKYADGEATLGDLVSWIAAADQLQLSYFCTHRSPDADRGPDEDIEEDPAWGALVWVLAATDCKVMDHLDGDGRILGSAVPPAAQAALLGDIFGKPFRPASVSPSWLATNDGRVRKLAQAIYYGRAFDLLPLLADALENAGCEDAAILGHCRGGGEHVRGCWPVDLLLGKE